MSNSICLDKKILEGIRTIKKTERFVNRFGRTTLSEFVCASIKILANKSEHCFQCHFHKTQIANLELGRQRLAIAKTGAIKASKRQWVRCDAESLSIARAYGKRCGRTIREVVEQALLEQITRPSGCTDCPIFNGVKIETLRRQQLEKQDSTGSCPETKG